MRACLRCDACFEGPAWRCPACGHEPALRGGFPAFAPELAGAGSGFDPALFDELARLESRHFWFRARNRLIVWALDRYFPHARRILEVGCGTGFVLSGVAAARPHAELTGSEVEPGGLAHAARRVPGAQLIQMDARRVPYRDEFDLCAACDVIEHIEDDAAVLAALHRAAVPGGGLLITVPQHPWLWSAHDEHARHVRRYRAAELRRKVTQAGWTVLRMTSFVSLLLPAMALSRLARRRADAAADPLAELRIGPAANWLLERALDAERALIRAGVPLPAGGSLLVVARRSHP